MISGKLSISNRVTGLSVESQFPTSIRRQMHSESIALVTMTGRWIAVPRSFQVFFRSDCAFRPPIPLNGSED
jgi:hypothetical protein